MRKELSYSDLKISLQEILEAMQYGKEAPNETALKEIETVEKTLNEIVHPRFVYQTLNPQPSALCYFDLGKIISHQLKDSDSYIVFICTAGKEFMDYQEKIKAESDIFKIFIVDSIGSIIAEKCADIMEKELEKELLPQGLHHTNRFSPGYCGWHVSQQQKLFPLFNGETCEVKLTPSSLMVPIKSVSGIIGIGKNVSKREYTCHLCDYTQCYKRKQKKLIEY